jgi:xylulokinase
LVFPKGNSLQGEDVDDLNYQKLNDWAEESTAGARGLFFLPWMYGGERCPINDDWVRAAFFNLSLHHGPSELVRAIFEGVAFNIRWALETLQNLYQPVEELSIVGGGAKSDLWCQIIADITGKKIRRVENPQLAGAKGIALLASMTLGYLEKFEQIKEYIKIKKVFIPRNEHHSLYDSLFKEYKNLYYQNKKWFRRVNSIFS